MSKTAGQILYRSIHRAHRQWSSSRFISRELWRPAHGRTRAPLPPFMFLSGQCDKFGFIFVPPQTQVLRYRYRYKCRCRYFDLCLQVRGVRSADTFIAKWSWQV